jgi:hypothetical protein
MPFGKHAGRPISEVPTQYLRWMYNDCNFTCYPELQRAPEQYLGLPPDPSIRVGVVKDSGGKPAGGPNLPQAGVTPRLGKNCTLRADEGGGHKPSFGTLEEYG